MKIKFKSILLLVLFFILQVVWFNHVQIWHTYTPIIFIYPLLRFSLQKDENYSLILAFLLGISLDIVSNTGGVFAATAVMVTYLRKIYFYIIKSQARDFDKIQIEQLAFSQRILFYGVFILISQFFIYLLEAFNFNLTFHKLGVILINSLLSLVFFIFFDLFFFNHQEK